MVNSMNRKSPPKHSRISAAVKAAAGVGFAAAAVAGGAVYAQTPPTQSDELQIKYGAALLSDTIIYDGPLVTNELAYGMGTIASGVPTMTTAMPSECRVSTDWGSCIDDWVKNGIPTNVKLGAFVWTDPAGSPTDNGTVPVYLDVAKTKIISDVFASVLITPTTGGTSPSFAAVVMVSQSPGSIYQTVATDAKLLSLLGLPNAGESATLTDITANLNLAGSGFTVLASSVSPVPEMSQTILMGAGLLGVGFMMRRRMAR